MASEVTSLDTDLFDTWMQVYFSKGLLVLLIGTVGGIFAGVGICMYFFHQNRMSIRRARIRPAEPVVKPPEIKKTKDNWNRERTIRSKDIKENGKVKDTAITLTPTPEPVTVEI